jgi:hypothetical protein
VCRGGRESNSGTTSERSEGRPGEAARGEEVSKTKRAVIERKREKKKEKKEEELLYVARFF